MDLRATTGLALIAAALVLGSMVLASGASGENRGADFFSIPKRKRDWLRLLLIALFVERRAGITFSVVSVLLAAAIFYAPLTG